MSKQLPIVISPKPILRQVTKEVPVDKIKTPKIQELILQMEETLKNTDDGVGLAASQVGEPLKIFLVSEEAEYVDNKKLPEGEERKPVDLSTGLGLAPLEARTSGAADAVGVLPLTGQVKKRDWKHFVYINPVVKKISKSKIEYPEGCLSIPGKFGFVKRSEKITVEAYDENGKKITRGASKFFARVIQHELDHLNGVLFIDKVERFIDIPTAQDKK